MKLRSLLLPYLSAWAEKIKRPAARTSKDRKMMPKPSASRKTSRIPKEKSCRAANPEANPASQNWSRRRKRPSARPHLPSPTLLRARYSLPLPVPPPRTMSRSRPPQRRRQARCRLDSWRRSSPGAPAPPWKGSSGTAAETSCARWRRAPARRCRTTSRLSPGTVAAEAAASLTVGRRERRPPPSPPRRQTSTAMRTPSTRRRRRPRPGSPSSLLLRLLYRPHSSLLPINLRRQRRLPSFPLPLLLLPPSSTRR